MTVKTNSVTGDTLPDTFTSASLVIPDSVRTHGISNIEATLISDLAEFEKKGKPIRKTIKFAFYND
jgi:hypothetical protein